MKYLSGCGNIFETEAWYFWGNMKVLLEHLDCVLGSKGPHSDPAGKTFWVYVLSAMFLKLLSQAPQLLLVLNQSNRTLLLTP